MIACFKKYGGSIPAAAMLLFSFFAVAPTGSRLYAEDLRLSPNWRISTGGGITGRPAVSGTRAYALAEDRYLYIVDVPLGEVERKVYLHKRVTGAPAVFSDGSIYFSDTADTLHGINGRGGEIWSARTAGALSGEIVADPEGFLYAAGEDGTIYSFTQSGRRRWSFSTPWKEKTVFTLIPKDNALFITQKSGSLLLLPTKSVEWKNTRQHSPPVACFPLGDGLICSVYRSSIECIDLSGNVIWKKEMSIGRENGTGFLLGEHRICTVDAEGNFRVYGDPEEGGKEILRGSFQHEGTISGVNLSGSTLVMGCDEWILYGFTLPESMRGKNPKKGERVFPYTWDRHSFDYMYLRDLALNGDRGSRTKFIEAVEDRIVNKKVEGSDIYILFLLEKVLAGSFSGSGGSPVQALGKDPDLRGRAALLMGFLGNLQTRDALLNQLRFEYDKGVQASIIHALGELRSDPGGEGAQLFERIIQHDAATERDPSLAGEVIYAVTSFAGYRGGGPTRQEAKVLLSIFRADYPRKIRKQALEALENKQYD